MPVYEFTDKDTGEKIRIRRNTPEEAIQTFKSLRQPVGSTDTSLTGFAKEVASAPYLDPATGKPRSPEFLKAAAEPFVGTAKGLYGLAKPLTEGKLPTREDLLRGGAAALGVMFPEVLPILSAANVGGEAVLGVTGSPLAAGITQNIASFISPGGVKRTAESLAKSATGRIAAKTAAEEAARAGVSEAEKGVTAAEERIGAAEKGAAELGRKAEEARTAIPRATQAKEAAQLRAGLAKTEAERIGAAQMPPPKTTTLQFGEKFQGPDFAKPGEFHGYYAQAKAERGAIKTELYNDVDKIAAGAVTDKEKLAQNIRADLESKGIAADIVPIQPEIFGKRLLGQIEADDEELGYQGMRQILQEPWERQPGQRPRDIEIAAGTYGEVPKGYTKVVPRTLSEIRPSIEAGKTAPASLEPGFVPQEPAMTETGKALAAMFKDVKDPKVAANIQKILTEGGLPVIPDLPASDAVVLHRRLNGAYRAAENAKRFDLAREILNYKKFIDDSLPKEVRASLSKADDWYKRNYAPYFSGDAELRNIIDKKYPSQIFKSIVPSKDNPAIVTQAMEILSPEGKQALRGAFYHHLYDSAVDLRTGVDWNKLVGEYDSFTPEVKQALLGESKPAWDAMIGNIHNVQTEAAQNVMETAQALRSASADMRRAETRYRVSLKAQQSALGIMEAGKRGWTETALQNLKSKQKALDEAMNNLKEAQMPLHFKGGYLRTRKQMLLVFGAMDLASYALGFGAPNALKYGVRDMAILYLLSDPRILGGMLRNGNRGIESIAGYMASRMADPAKLQKGIAALNFARDLAAEEKRGK